jgi:hypothetical protein
VPLHAATATATTAATTPPGSGGAVLFLALTGIMLGYLFVCWLRPFRTCRRCGGTGRRPMWIGSGFRYCTPCQGTGHALRTGRRLINALRATHDRAQH